MPHPTTAAPKQARHHMTMHSTTGPNPSVHYLGQPDPSRPSLTAAGHTRHNHTPPDPSATYRCLPDQRLPYTGLQHRTGLSARTKPNRSLPCPSGPGQTRPRHTGSCTAEPQLIVQKFEMGDGEPSETRPEIRQPDNPSRLLQKGVEFLSLHVLGKIHH